jgi:hypothetical protein
LQKAKEQAKKVVCLGQLKQIVLATYTYADDYNGTFPSRSPIGYGYTHAMKRTTTTGAYDLYPTFVNPYMNGRNNMLCPGLPDGVTLSSNGAPEDEFIGYQYHVTPKNFYWQVPWPDMRKPANIKKSAPLWTCLTWQNGKLVYISHGRPGLPTGANTARSDGSAEWTQWSDMEYYWFYSAATGKFYWPKYRQ